MFDPVSFTDGLLDSLFGDPDEVRAFVVRNLERGTELAANLPSTSVPKQQYVLRLTEHLSHRGELTWAHFFAPLVSFLPNRAADIRVVSHQVERRAFGTWLARDLESRFARDAVENLTRILALSRAELLESAHKSDPSATLRATFAARWPTRDDLAEWTLDKIRGLKFAADCAELLDMPRIAFEAGIADGQGHIILRKAFPGKFQKPARAAAQAAPSPTATATTTSTNSTVSVLSTLERDLGSLTAKEARQRGLAPSIAFLIGASPAHVETILADVHGRNYIRNLFWEDWPEDDRFGDLSVSQVRAHHLLGTIASITGLDFLQVRDRIQDPTVYELPVRTVFVEEWPVYEAEDDDADAEVHDLDYEKLTVKDALSSGYDEVVRNAIGYLTNIRSKRVEEALFAAPRTFRVRDVFAGHWPSQDDWLQVSVSNLRRYSLETTFARLLGWPVEALKARLVGEHGNTLLSKVVQGRVQNAPKISLGELTLAEVDRRGLREVLTSFLVDGGLLQQRGVTRRFNANNGNARVRNVFGEVDASEWPDV